MCLKVTVQGLRPSFFVCFFGLNLILRLQNVSPPYYITSHTNYINSELQLRKAVRHYLRRHF